MKEQKEESSSSLHQLMHLHNLEANQKRILDLIHSNYAHALEVELSSFLKKDISCVLLSTEQKTFSSYSEELSNPSFICIFYVEKLNGYGVLEIHPKIIYAVVDRMTGGEGESFQEVQVFTPLELAVTQRFVELLMKQLEEVWASFFALTFEPKKVQTNPFLVNAIASQEICVVLTLEIKVGNIKEKISLCFPYSDIEPIIAKAQRQDDSYTSKASKEVEEVLKKNLGKVCLHLQGILGEMELSFRELRALQPGDVLDLGKKRKRGVIVRVEDRNKFEAHLGLLGKFRGLSIIKEIREE